MNGCDSCGTERVIFHTLSIGKWKDVTLCEVYMKELVENTQEYMRKLKI